jgi:hypothetical protein
MKKTDLTPAHQGKTDDQNSKEHGKFSPPAREEDDPTFEEKWEHSAERQYEAGIIADEDEESN